MADPKNVIVDIKNGLADVRQQMNLLKQETSGWVSSLSSGVSRLTGMGGGGSGGGFSSTLVAPNPKFSQPAGFAVSGGGQSNPIQGGALTSSGSGGNLVAYTPSISSAGGGGGGGSYSGNTSLSNYVEKNPAAGFLYGAAITGGMVDQPGESVEAQLLMSRVAYFNKQSNNAGTSKVAMGPTAYDNINNLQAKLSGEATTKDKMDVSRGLAAAQSIGVTGKNITQASNGMGSVASGVAAASNLVPGAGFEGTMRAFSSMQQGRNVNMLRGIGIQLRDDQGNMKPPDQIIDDIWKKICRDYAGAYGAGKKPSKQEVLIGLQPGNSMDSMLDMYFGNDPMAKQMVANGLIYKAETGGAAISKDTLIKLGATTNAVNAQSARNAAQARQTGLTANAGAEGYTIAAKAITDFSTFMTDKALPILEGVTKTNAGIVTLLGAANDTGAKGLAILLAQGGKTAAITASVVAGAAGVSLGASLLPPLLSNFVKPEFLNGGAGPKGSGVGATDPERDKFATEVLKGIGAKPTEENIEAMQIWMNKEGGSTRNSASYNYLNTSAKMPGSVNYKTRQEEKGVQAYNSFEEGVAATIKTFNDPGAEGYGYNKLKDLFKKGAPKSEIFAQLKQTSWSEDRYKGVDFNQISPDYNGPGSTTNSNNTTYTFQINANGSSIQSFESIIRKIMNEQNIKDKAVNK